MRSLRFAIICVSLIALTCPVHSGEVRSPAVAGTFYPADSARLADMVRHHLAAVENIPPVDGELLALIVPHAGLIYSGPIAAYAYKALEQQPTKDVVLCGPSHRYPFDGISVYGPGITWRTPLGEVACDSSLCERLLKSDSRFGVVAEAQAAEHSLEVQLPYLQTLLRDFRIVPVTMGRQSAANARALTDGLAELVAESSCVLIAATDWQHYRPAAEGWKYDSLGVECVRDLDPERLAKMIDAGQVEACGGGPTVAVLEAAIQNGANRVEILRYGDSGDISGDKSSVVGYLAAAIYRSKRPSSDAGEAEANSYSLSRLDKLTLLDIARESIQAHLDNQPTPEFEVSGALSEPGAAFVTLNKNHRLRGCIGYTSAVRPLFQTVSECAVQAAVNDPRFPQVSASELDDLEIEISVLTPLEVVSDLKAIEVGRDGLMIARGGRRGLLLPQVATEYGWDRQEFLQNTCRKAGLPGDAYMSPDAFIYRFRALVFSEADL